MMHANARDYDFEQFTPPPDDEPPPNGPDDYGTSRQQHPPEFDFTGIPLSISEWLARDLPSPDMIMGDWLSTTSRALLVAGTGLGKTNFAMALGMAVAAGTSFLHWAARRPAKVLYIDGEMSRRLLQQRITDATGRLGETPAGFFAFSHEDIENFAPLNTPAGQACIEALIERLGGVDLIIFDSIMCLTAGDMKDEESWQQTMPWVRSLTRRSIGQVWVHHTGHDETRGYGTKTREWQLDTVMVLEAVRRDDTDVSFVLEFRKARERTPATRADFAPVKVWLGEQWEWSGGERVPGELKRRLNDRQRLALDILVDCALDHGKPPPVAFGLPKGLTAVSADKWRDELFARGVLDREEANPREAFRRIRNSLANRKMIGERDGLVWRAA
ncbi:hypothetical protein A33M_2915 [Rhodovulum sp. PH10]|uniref:AAA family ATPase n=1 Tax=Rhodovulum sp. PH10 TaxID=1187851 RepID=UPI00027C2B4B|nr:AAA family ATPase [Rhodovulum sp. PH10]EJW11718.1 hypothetical protein A33M_2915 [Rhodovulum sp. PH10]